MSKVKEISIPLESMLTEYNNLKEQKKTVEARMKYLADKIKAEAEKVGVKDDKGSYYAENEQFIFGKQCKKSVTFNEEKALAYFKAHDLEDCIKTVEVIDEDCVEVHINSGDISFEDLEEITDTKVTYAVDVKKKDTVVDVVEQTSVPLAASKKPRIVPKGGKK